MDGLTSCVLANHLFLGSRLSSRKSRKEKGSGRTKEVLVGKLKVEGDGGRKRVSERERAALMSAYMHSRNQIASVKT